jgi:hypothetical protein
MAKEVKTKLKRKGIKIGQATDAIPRRKRLGGTRGSGATYLLYEWYNGDELERAKSEAASLREDGHRAFVSMEFGYAVVYWREAK